jgi:hypothetical protein
LLSILVLGVGFEAGLVAALLLVWLCRLLLARGARRVGAAVFLVLPPLAWTLQELSERLLGSESAPFADSAGSLVDEDVDVTDGSCFGEA